MVIYTAIGQNGIDIKEAEKCLVPFGYRITEGRIERPSEYKEPTYESLAQGIEQKLRGLEGKTLEDHVVNTIRVGLFLESDYTFEQVRLSKDLFIDNIIDSFFLQSFFVELENVYQVVVDSAKDINQGIFLNVENIAMYIREKWGVPGAVAPREQPQTPQGSEPPK